MEEKLKHLEFIQLTITRMAANSFVIKGWVITLMAAVFAVSTGIQNSYIPFLNYFIVPVFWILDGYYLSQERKYRGLYDEIRLKENSAIDFSMNTKKFKEGDYKWTSSIFSKTLIIFYILLILISIGILKLISHG